MNIKFIPMHYERDWDWLQLVLPIPATNKTTGIIAVNEKEDGSTEPVGAALFDMWTHTGVCVHWWMDTPMLIRHGFFNEICSYVFGECGKNVIIGIIPDNSVKSMNLAVKLGLVEVGRIKEGYNVGVDQVILEVRVENAGRWFKPVLNDKEEAA